MWKLRWTSLIKKIRLVETTKDEQALLASLANISKPQVLAFVNAHAMNCCASNPAFYDALISADLLLRDGSGMAMLYKHAQCNPGMNMNGTDFIPKILSTFKGRNVAFWGTQEPFLTAAKLRSESEFGIRIASCEGGFENFSHYLTLASNTQPDLIVLGMGMPKQEQLAQLLKTHASGSPLIVCGGAIVDFLGGKVKRAPKVMRHAGLEWLYRFGQEPGRLFHRYVVGNPAFLIKVRAWVHDKTA